MGKNRYQEEFNEIHFSANFEQRVVSSIENQMSRTGGTKKRIGVVIPAVSLVLIILVLVIRGNLGSNVTENNIAEQAAADSMEKIEIDETGVVDFLSIQPDTMAVLEYTGKKNTTQKMEGTLTGKQLLYDVGYLQNGEYCLLEEKVTSPDLAAVINGENGKYSWCITNRSTELLTVQGQIREENRDLVYRTYGESAITAEKGMHMLIENVFAFVEQDEIQKLCIIRYEDSSIVEREAENGTLDYEVPRDGTYGVYVITTDGAVIDISNKVSIEGETELYDQDGVTPGIIGL